MAYPLLNGSYKNKNFKTMKTKIILLALISTLTIASFAQSNDAEVITITTSLNTTMALNLETTGITFDFNTLEEYSNGKGGKYSDWATTAGVSSTANWEFFFKASTGFMHEDGNTQMPYDNLGVTIDWTGTNNSKVYCKNTPLALSDQNVLLIGQQGNQSNAGDETANSFVIYWELGTTNGNMNSENLFEQDLKKGVYQVDIEMIVTEVL